jgi:hypothetical protein
MSSVLPTPTLPTLVNIEELKAYIQSEIKKGIEKVLSDPENPLLKRVNALTEENVRLLRHISILEGHLNINYADYDNFCLTGNTYEDLKEEGITPFCDRIEQRTVIAPEKPIEEKKDNSPAIPSTSLDFKAVALKVHLHENVKPNWAGEICLETKEFNNFMIDKIDEKLRWKPDLRNKREAKKQIFDRALEMFPHLLELKRSKSGKHVTGIALTNVGKT